MPLKPLLAGALIVLAMAHPLSAQSQHRETQNAVVASPQLKFEELSAGEIRAQISDSGQSTPQAVGSSAFASIKLRMNGASEPVKARNRAKTATGVSAFIDLESDGGDIVNITGENLTSGIEPQKATTQISGLRGGEETTVLVEIRLKAAPANQNTTLKVTLRNAVGLASDTAKLRWTARDCAGDFYRELQVIAASGGSQLSKLLSDMRVADKSASRDMIFPASRSSSGDGGRCVRYKRQWDPFEFGYRRVCVRYKGGEPVEDAAANSSNPREEREILQRASAIVRTGGADPKFGRDGSLEWVSGKIASDLRVYLEQPPHPAICTGAPQMTDYYLKQAGGLKAHAETVISLAQKARSLAAMKTAQAREAVAAISGGHPGVGMAPLPVSAPQGEGESLKALILSIAPYAGMNADGVAALSQGQDELAMLRAIRDAIDANDDADKATLKAVKPALALIEAAVRLTLAEGRYQGLRTKFIGSFENVRAAHDKFCVCGG